MKYVHASHQYFLNIIGCTLLFLFALNTHAQQYFTAEESYAIKLGRTQPLYNLVPSAPTDTFKLKQRKKNKPYYVPNFIGRRHQFFDSPDALPKGKDPLFDPSGSRMANEILPKVNFEGISEAAVFAGVPDVNGDISRDYFVEIVNATSFRVYDKTGQPLSNLISANTIWNQVQQTSAGDPILLYDQLADRWLLTEFPSNNRVLLAISVTNDPRGSWDAYAFQTPRFPDFPKYGIWHDAYYLTTNESGANFPIYAFNRADFLASKDTVKMQRLTMPKIGGVFFEVGQPIDWDGMTPPPAGSPGLVVKLNDDDWGTTQEDQIILHKIHIDWDTSSNSNIELVEIPTAPFDSDGCSMESTGGFSCVPQPNGQGIDGAEWIITNKAQYRNFGTHESFVMSFMVDVTGDEVAGIRWMEFRKTQSEDWHIFQEGTVGSDDGLHRFMSSIGIDGQGNIALAYSISGENKHPSLRYTGRYAQDPLGEMTFQEYEFATGTGSLGNDRFGDYASMSVDPSDEQTFWFAGEYVLANGNWTTRVVSFSASRDTIDLLPVSLITPQSGPDLSANEPLTISVLNRGLNTVHDFKLAYQFSGGNWIVEEATLDSLEVDSVYIHTFQSELDFNTPGTFALRIASVLEEDRNHRNDTLSFVIQKPAHRDVAVQFSLPGEDEVICAHSGETPVTLSNLGVDDVTSVSMQLIINSQIADTVEWTGSLPFGDETFIAVQLVNLVEGLNTIELNVISVNDLSDEVTVNDQIIREITAKPDGEPLWLVLNTDNFPQETSWELVNAGNIVIASGGPFDEQQTEYVVPFCLDPDTCYTFIIYDAFGDGMSAQGVTGDFEIVNGVGDVLASLSRPNFGLVEANQFCLTAECLLDVFAGIQHVSSPGATDGWILAEVNNANGAVEYSINGGFSFQANPLFENLAAGTYTLIANDLAGCQDTLSFVIQTCNLQTLVVTHPASGGDVGQIHIAATGGVGPLSYSLDGITFVSDSFFIMLEPGDYVVYTRDSLGCERIDSVTVSTNVSTNDQHNNHFIKLSPNPGRGVYDVLGKLPVNDVFIPFKVYTSQGELIQVGTIARYDEFYKGELSLVAYPSGTYVFALYLDGSLLVQRVVKL